MAPLSIFWSGENKKLETVLDWNCLYVGQAFILVQQGNYESTSPNKLGPLVTVSTGQASHAEVFAPQAEELGAFSRRVHARQQRNGTRRQVASRVAAAASAADRDPESEGSGDLLTGVRG